MLKKLSDLNIEIGNCQKCALCKTRLQAVSGDGESNVRVMFVGEAPGATEDRIGIPFCGAAGKFLTEMMTENGFARHPVGTQEGIYITNIVKCRPPDNRDPKESEKKICSEYLDRQIQILKPTIIVPLGRHSMWYFLPALKISEAHGQVYQREDGIYIIPLYHPAAALYQGSMRAVHRHDFQSIRQLLRKLEKTK